MSITRRRFLQASGSLGVWCGLPAAHLLEVAQPVPRSEKTLVVLFLRGGLDGLNLVVPHAEPDYYAMRNWLAVARPGQPDGALELDGTFGLHPRASALLPFFQSGVGAALHAVGHERNTRSHFEEQDVWETGVVDNTLHTDGWLNRYLAATESAAPVRAVSIGESLPRLLRGQAEALAIRGLSDLSLGGADFENTHAALTAAYRGKDDQERVWELLTTSARSALGALHELQPIADAPNESAVTYPETQLGRNLREAARLIQAGVGIEIAEVDFGGWDTHQNQGVTGGTYGRLVSQLSDALAAFLHDLEDRLDDVLVLAFSEFGRTAELNGTGGTDHGWGNCLFAFGGPVLRAGGGKARGVLGRWPGLSRDALNQERDLAHTTDFRDVFAEVAHKHLEFQAPETLFPGRKFEAVGLV